MRRRLAQLRANRAPVAGSSRDGARVGDASSSRDKGKGKAPAEEKPRGKKRRASALEEEEDLAKELIAPGSNEVLNPRKVWFESHAAASGERLPPAHVMWASVVDWDRGHTWNGQPIPRMPVCDLPRYLSDKARELEGQDGSERCLLDECDMR